MTGLFQKGDPVTVVLRGAGYETREAASVLKIDDKTVWVDNGPGNDPDPYHLLTGKYARDNLSGFSRWIEKA